MYAESDRPTLEEGYILATSTSDLTLNPDRVCSATHLIAAGLTGNRMAEALSHLRGSWDALGKLPKWTEADVRARAQVLPRKGAGLDLKRARAEAHAAYNRALRERFMRLPGRFAALAIMQEWATLRKVDADALSPALYRWLDPSCPVCDGHGKLRLPDAPAFGKSCIACDGHGTRRQTDEGRRVSDWLHGCEGKGQADRRGILSGRVDSDDLAERAAARPKPPAADERGAAAVAKVAAASMDKRYDRKVLRKRG